MTNEEKAKELRQFVCNTHMTNGGKALNMLSLHNQRNADLENIWKLCEKTAVEMAQWKDEQFAAEKHDLIDKACSWLENIIFDKVDALFYDDNDIEFVKTVSGKEFTDIFRKAMEETK